MDIKDNDKSRKIRQTLGLESEAWDSSDMSGANRRTQDTQSLARYKTFASFFQNDYQSEMTNEAPVRPASVTIMKPIGEVYAFIRDLTNMPRFIRDLQRVEVTSDRLSHWVFEKDGQIHEHDSQIIAEEPGRLFAWRSLGDITKAKTGVVMLDVAAGGRGTVVSLRMSDDDTPGKIAGMMSYFGGKDPKSKSYVNLRRLKAYLETGEVPTIEGQPNGNDETNHSTRQ